MKEAATDTAEFLTVLQDVIAERIRASSPESYVASLVAGGDKRLAQKLGEEAVELAIAVVAGDMEEQCEEAADLLFHLLVLLNAKGIQLADVEAVLKRRHASRRG
jgi:phosphoribosyl-ATP pyrophosphohydrolase